MNVTGKTKIYRKDYNGRPSYSRLISSQEYKDGKKGEWITAFESVQFPKGADIPDRTIVEIQGFEATYKRKDGNVERKLVVQRYNVLDVPEQKRYDMPEGFSHIPDEEVPF